MVKMMLIVAGTMLLSPALPRQQGPNRDLSNRLILALEGRWLRLENNPDSLATIFAPDFMHVTSQGIITGQQQLAFMRAHPVTGQPAHKHFEDLRIRVYGTIGILNGIVVAGDGPSATRTFFTDVFAYRAGAWKAINAQELPAAPSR
ncbi:MAG TPA: nuclear transport factor 2 family protein [Gemmatimonadales bacterium]|jgi:hypothetical protein